MAEPEAVSMARDSDSADSVAVSSDSSDLCDGQQSSDDGGDAGPEENQAGQSFGVGVEPYLFEPEYGSDDPDEMMDAAVIDDDDAEPGDEDRRLHDLEYWCDIFHFFSRPYGLVFDIIFPQFHVVVAEL
jgi:hypothetical protein